MRKLWNNHPNLVSWAVLALGMVIIVIIAARSVGFQPAQWAAVIIATIALAGLCVWIVSWEDAPGGAPDGVPQATPGGALPSGVEQSPAPAEAAQADAARRGEL